MTFIRNYGIKMTSVQYVALTLLSRIIIDMENYENQEKSNLLIKGELINRDKP